MQYPLHTTTSPVVRKQSRKIPREELSQKEMQNFFDDLITAMMTYDGIGIAACQIGKPWQAIVVDKQYSGTPQHLVLVNPRLVSTSKKAGVMEEGCLSVPNLFGPVERPIKVRVKAWMRDGAPCDWKAKGMFARILQHELDHLQGILFIDKALFTREKTLEEHRAVRREKEKAHNTNDAAP